MFFPDGVALKAPAARVRGLILGGQKVCGVRVFQRIWRDQGGATLLDYSILVALITVIVVFGVSVAGSWIQGMWIHLLPLLG
jgi:Flp pilus assembly pilin Flp